MTRVVIVNNKDQPIDLKSYGDLVYEDIYRVSALWLSDTKTGDYLMTQRKWTKHNDPGKWMAAASGTIEEGETYDVNIVHEIEEEIGLKNLDLTKGSKEFIDEGKHKFFVQWYFAEVDKDKVSIKIQEDEVEQYAWVPKQRLIEEIGADPDKFVPTIEDSLKAIERFGS